MSAADCKISSNSNLRNVIQVIEHDVRPTHSVISIWHFRAGGTYKRRCWITMQAVVHFHTDRADVEDRNKQLQLYLDHGQHAIVGDGVGADGEVPGGVATDDAVDSVPVGAVGLIPVHHRQVGHHHVHLVLWHLSRKLQSGRETRRWMREEGGEVTGGEDGGGNIMLMLFQRWATAC